MVGHGEVHHACGALLLGQFQTSPALEHSGLGVLVCGGLELCTHRHSLQVGNSAAVLQGDLCIGDLELIGLGSVLGVLCFQCNVVCGHLEGNGCLGGVHVSGQTGHFPAGEGVAVLLGCGGNELCAHRHSLQVGNSAAVLQGDLCIGDLELIGLGSVLGVLCFQRNLVCGHREGDGRLSGVHVSGQTGHFPTGEGVTVLLGCGGNELCTHRHSLQVGNSAAILQGDLCIGDLELIGLGSVLGVLCFQRNLVCGHREGDGRLSGVHVSGQTGHFPTGEGVTVLLVCGEAELLTCNVLGRLVVHGQGVLRLRHSIGAHFVLVANVVVTIIHHDVDRVGACLGGLRHRRERAILRAILDRIQRGIVKIHLAVIGCSLGLGVIRKVGAARGIFAYHLADIKRAFCVLVALLRYDALLVDAVLVIRRVGCKHLVVGGAHIDEAQFAHAILFAGNARDERAPVDVKVALAQGREGQLSGGGHVHHNRLAVILGGDSQRAVNGRGALVVIAGFRTVDVRDCIAEADLCLDITDKVNRVCCCGIVVEAFHSAVRHHQLALLLTGGEVFAFNIAAAHRIGNSSLAISIRHQAAGDHGILDDRSFRCIIIVGQLDIVEHAAKDLGITTIQLDSCVELTAGDLAVSLDALLEGAAGDGAVIAQTDLRFELTIGDLAVSLDALLEDAVGDGSISFDALLEGAACDAAVSIRVNSLLESAALNNGVLGDNRRASLNTSNRHIRQHDLIGSNSCMMGVDGIRGQIHRAAIRAGEDKHRHRSITILVLTGDLSVLPAKTLVDIAGHTTLAHGMRGHTGPVGQTFFGNAQGLEVAGIASLIYQNLLAIVVAGDMQYSALGIGLFIVTVGRCTVDAEHIGVQGKLCAGIAHQIDGIDRKGQVSAVDRSHTTAVAHGQRAELLAIGKRILYAVARQLAQNGVGNGKVAKPVKAEVLGHCLGNGALAHAGEVIKGAALDRDIFEVSLTDDAAGHGSIRKLDIAVDGHCAQLAEIDHLTALIPELQLSGRTGDIGVAGISSALAKVYADLIYALVQTVHMGHIVHIGRTLIGKTQFLVHRRDRSQCYGCVAL